MIPHEGPHSCTPTSYIPSYAYLSGKGKYAILLVNYRASQGFGQSSIELIPSNSRILDVSDCVQAVESLFDKEFRDENRVGFCGESHGGYLDGHFIGQHGSLFKVTAMRNPVLIIVTMVSATYIPDWCYVEALGLGNYNSRLVKG